MSFFKNLLGFKRHDNPAIHRLYKQSSDPGQDVEDLISKLSRLGKTYDEGGRYLLKKTMIDQIAYYDEQYGGTLSKRLTDETNLQLLHKTFDLMLFFFYEALRNHLKEAKHAGLLTEGLHFELYQSPAREEHFIAFLNYQNPHYEDVNMLPAHKFSADVAAILSIPDLSFTFMVAQQVAVISEVSGKLMRWVLFEEKIDGPSENPETRPPKDAPPQI